MPAMPDSTFDQNAWLQRIGYSSTREPTLATLNALVTAHSLAISYESLDVLLGRPPKLDVAVLQNKMILGRRGGYCFEQNILFRAGLRSLGFEVTSLQARVVRGLPVDAPRPALHMVLRVDLPEGPHLADVGFGNLAPTSALALQPLVEQATPHETMRFITMGEELTLQSRLGDKWEHIYRVVPHPRVDMEYEIANWYTGSHPDSPYLSNIIAARPGPERTRLTLFNARLNIRDGVGRFERRLLDGEPAYRDALERLFGIVLTDGELRAALAVVEKRGTRGAPHPFFA
jgi:N-hydroxyarylamine O-acetyltransferase